VALYLEVLYRIEEKERKSLTGLLDFDFFSFFFVIFAKKKELGEMEHEGNERRMGDLVPLFKWISWIFVFSFYSF